MKVISLLYHDVVPAGRWEASGFPEPDACIYKLEVAEFERHLAALQQAVICPVTVTDLPDYSGCPVLLTFDDGGSSAHDRIAGMIEARGWRGHFFVTTDWIGRRGFLSASQIRDLRARGHVIGSHSCSHPPRMSYCSARQLEQEWKNSIACLADIVGSPVETASVPGGYYARNVAAAAVDAGIRTLFTSEPDARVREVDGCRILGRYTLQRGSDAALAAALASGRLWPRSRQYVYWNFKKAVKTVGGTSWLRMRRWVLAR